MDAADVVACPGADRVLRVGAVVAGGDEMDGSIVGDDGSRVPVGLGAEIADDLESRPCRPAIAAAAEDEIDVPVILCLSTRPSAKASRSPLAAVTSAGMR